MNGGYMLNKDFLAYYSKDPALYHYERTYLRVSEVWQLTGQSCHQIRTDSEYLYGILVAACREIDNKIMIKHSEDKNGIIAWMEMRKEYDYEGSKTLKIDECMDIIHKDFQNNMTGGLAAYLDIFVVALNQLEILQGVDYAEEQKKQILLKNIKQAHDIKHLIQNCRDNNNTWGFYQMVSYLRENSKTVEAHPSSKKRVMATIVEEPEAKSQRSMQETMDLFEEVVRQGSIYQAYQAFNSAPLARA